MLALLRLVSVRHLFGHPLRSALTLFGVAIGVATLVGIAAINRTVMDAFRSTIDTIAGKADLTVAGSESGLPEEKLEEIRKVDGVTHASGALTFIAPVANSPGESLYVMGVDLLDDGYFRTYEGVDRDVGALADDLEFLNSTDRMLVSERFTEAHHLKTGDTFELITPLGKKPFVVHGQLKETGPVKAFGGSVAVMFFGSAQEAFGKGRRFDRVDVAVADPKAASAVQDRLQAAVGAEYDVDHPDRRGQSVETMLRSFQLGLNLGSAVALLVGVFLVYNTVSIGVVQRRREIGTLRALGATKAKIRLLFTLEAMLVGTLGSLLGLPLGIMVGRAAISAVADSVSSIYVRVNVHDVTIGRAELVVGLLLGIAGSVVAALRPAVVASGVQPVEALRRDVAVGAGAVKVKSWPTYLGVALFVLAGPATLIPPPVENFSVGGYVSVFFILMGTTLLSPLLLRVLNRPFQGPGEAVFGISGRLAADNFARAPVRTAVPVSALTIGVAMAVTVAGFVGSFQLSAQKWIEQAVPADLFVTASAKIAGVQNQQLPATLIAELEHSPGIEKVNPLRFLSHDVLGLRVFILSLIPEIYAERAQPTLIAGSVPTPEERDRNYVTISENLARRRNLHPGDRFPIRTPTGEHQYVVGAIIIDYTSDQGVVFMDRAVYARDFKDDQVDTFHVYVKDLAHLDEVRQHITATWGRKYDLYVLSNAELRKEAYDLIGNAFQITWAMEIVAMVLALLGVINTLLAAVLDRTREIGLLRAIGADRRHVQRLFTGEAAFIGLTGGVIGTVVGAVVGYIVTKVVGVQATGWNFPFHYPFLVAAQMFVASWFCAVVAGLYPARRASSLDVVEALAYE